jgi:hypothetical protein
MIQVLDAPVRITDATVAVRVGASGLRRTDTPAAGGANRAQTGECFLNGAAIAELEALLHLGQDEGCVRKSDRPLKSIEWVQHVVAAQNPRVLSTIVAGNLSFLSKTLSV